jgi:hypothetical protein
MNPLQSIVNYIDKKDLSKENEEKIKNFLLDEIEKHNEIRSKFKNKLRSYTSTPYLSKDPLNYELIVFLLSDLISKNKDEYLLDFLQTKINYLDFASFSSLIILNIGFNRTELANLMLEYLKANINYNWHSGMISEIKYHNNNLISLYVNDDPENIKESTKKVIKYTFVGNFFNDYPEDYIKFRLEEQILSIPYITNYLIYNLMILTIEDVKGIDIFNYLKSDIRNRKSVLNLNELMDYGNWENFVKDYIYEYKKSWESLINNHDKHFFLSFFLILSIYHEKYNLIPSLYQCLTIKSHNLNDDSIIIFSQKIYVIEKNNFSFGFAKLYDKIFNDSIGYMDLYEDKFTLGNIVSCLIKIIFTTDFEDEESWSVYFYKNIIKEEKEDESFEIPPF